MTPEILFTMALGLGEGWSVKSCSFEGTPLELLLERFKQSYSHKR